MPLHCSFKMVHFVVVHESHLNFLKNIVATLKLQCWRAHVESPAAESSDAQGVSKSPVIPPPRLLAQRKPGHTAQS